MGMLMSFGMLFFGLFGLALIVGVVAVVSSLFQNGRSSSKAEGAQTPRQILDQRYARGELTLEQYDQMKRDLE